MHMYIRKVVNIAHHSSFGLLSPTFTTQPHPSFVHHTSTHKQHYRIHIINMHTIFLFTYITCNKPLPCFSFNYCVHLLISLICQSCINGLWSKLLCAAVLSICLFDAICSVCVCTWCVHVCECVCQWRSQAD